MHKYEIDWTIFWRSLGNISKDDDIDLMVNKLSYSFYNNNNNNDQINDLKTILKE